MRYFLIFMYYLIFKKWPHKLGGSKLRNLILKRTCAFCGDNVIIHENVYIGNGSRLSIGNHSIIGPESRLIMGHDIIIGNDVQIGPRCMFITNNHNFKDANTKFSEQGFNNKPINIEDDAWIGANVTILPGITIEKGAVVGAGAVVSKNVERYNIVAGNPIRIIGKRVANE